MSDQIIPPNRRLLVIDDNVMTHADFRKIFEAVATGDTDFDLAADLLVADMVTPGGISGRELAERLRKDKPGLKVIHTSGYSRGLSDANAGLEESCDFLPKPYDSASLVAIVRDSLDRDHRSLAQTS